MGMGREEREGGIVRMGDNETGREKGKEGRELRRMYKFRRRLGRSGGRQWKICRLQHRRACMFYSLSINF